MRVIKRSGNIVKFNPDKIKQAILAAMAAISRVDESLALSLTNEIVSRLDDKHREISIEDIQDVVETVLIEKSYSALVKEYIYYRIQRSQSRELREQLSIPEDGLKFSNSALTILNHRYLRQIDGKKETPTQMFRRIAKTIASGEQNRAHWEKIFFQLLSNRIFLPNTPCIANAGSNLCLFACFTLPVEDSIESIFTAVKNSAIVMKAGGGIGLSFSNLRPENDLVRSTEGIASGPVSFMLAFDSTVEVIKQGSIRRGGCLGLLRIDHPDIIKFITCKNKEGHLHNFNISVSLTDSFMEALETKSSYNLINPRHGSIVDSLDASYVFNLICQQAWTNGEPGVIFIDEINRYNPSTTQLIDAVNLCSEMPLLPYEACCLGSINLTKFVSEGDIVYASLKKVVHHCVRFLDNVIDVSTFPLPDIERATKASRKIGLGIMGFADMLYMLGIPYNSNQALDMADTLMRFINTEAKKASEKLAEDKGSFPDIESSIYTSPIRNAVRTVAAPTGSISVLAECSSGIEPNYALIYKRENVLDGKVLFEVNPVFERACKSRGINPQAQLSKILANKGRITGIPEFPLDMQEVFVTALEISPWWHVRMQSTFQEHIDSSLSKTVNLPFESTIADVEAIILQAHKEHCKGITVYRTDSRKVQVLGSLGEECPNCGDKLQYTEGCIQCPSCFFGKCDI